MKATLLNWMGTDEDIASAARVSFAKSAEEYSDAENERLIKYLAKHRHMSPFGHNFARFHIKAPIFVRAQLVKHEYLRMNEVSRRYVNTTPEFYFPEFFREAVKDKKQGSGGPHKDADMWEAVLATNCHQMANTYDVMIESGICPEQARMVLPQNTYTEWWWSGSMDAFANMINLRLKADTQAETRMIAQQINEQLEKVWPIGWKELVKDE